MKYIVIGGVAGGATAAARIRRNTEQAEIILFEKGEYISYANCGLPYYIGGVIAEREKLFVQTPEAFGKRFNIDVRTRSEVIAIHSADKTVDIRTSDGKTYTESYDKLLLSPGASPVRPPLPGIDNEGIFTLRNVNDTDAIKSYLQQHKVKRAVIIGAGFIGLEMAENLQEAGAEVAVVEILWCTSICCRKECISTWKRRWLLSSARSTDWRLFLNRAKGCLPIWCCYPSGYVPILHWRQRPDWR